MEDADSTEINPNTTHPGTKFLCTESTENTTRKYKKVLCTESKENTFRYLNKKIYIYNLKMFFQNVFT